MTGPAMEEEGFLRRWSRRKTETRLGQDPAPEAEGPVVPAPAAPPAPLPVAAPQPASAAAPVLPTMEDVARLGGDSDFSAFVARGVDQAVRRGALKKLFADPHFKAMDGLDVYIDDYTRPSPMSETMLASLEHAKTVFLRVLEEPADATAPAAVASPAGDPPGPPRPSQRPPEQETR